MARKLRLEYPGALYHVLNRGNQRGPIVRTEQDRLLFLRTLGEACAKTHWQIHAYCLMRNHFHLVVETPQANLVAGMKWFLGTYTARFNRHHKLCGHLFSGRYKALFVDGSGNGYLKTVCDYVHLNPARAKLLKPEQPLTVYRWSSYGEYLKESQQRAPWLRVDRLLGEHGIPKDSAAGRQEFEKRMEARRRAEDGGEFKGLMRGWCLGSEAFRQDLLAQMSDKVGAEHFGAEIQETCEAQAERIVGQELEKLHWTEQDLQQRPKGDAEKVRMAERLRQETTMSLSWVAQRLQMGTKTYLSHLLYWKARKKGAQADS